MKYTQVFISAVIFAITAWATLHALQTTEGRENIAKEITSLDKTIQRAALAAERTNEMLYDYTKYHAQNLSRITDVLVEHEKKLKDK